MTDDEVGGTLEETGVSLSRSEDRLVLRDPVAGVVITLAGGTAGDAAATMGALGGASFTVLDGTTPAARAAAAAAAAAFAALLGLPRVATGTGNPGIAEVAAAAGSLPLLRPDIQSMTIRGEKSAATATAKIR